MKTMQKLDFNYFITSLCIEYIVTFNTFNLRDPVIIF